MISKQEVKYVAQLARLHLEEAELESLQSELSTILGYVQQISELELSGLKLTSHAVALRNVLRPDVPAPGLPHDDAMHNAPQVERGQFVVPRIA